MLEKLIRDHGEHLEGAIMHSDQGWQYQMLYYRKFLQDHNIIQSMSRKGNCLDNSPTENFFGRLKTDMYYDKEYSFKSLSELKRNIRRYIRYYNEERIVTRLRTNPHQCRNSYYESVIWCVLRTHSPNYRGNNKARKHCVCGLSVFPTVCI